MLKRRNTIHPLQQCLPLVTEQEPYAFNPSPLKVSSITTNPFLSSSCDEDLSSAVRAPLPPHTWHSEVYSEDDYTTASYDTNKSPVHPFLETNPFLHSETTANDEDETTRLFGIINNNSHNHCHDQGEKQLRQPLRNIHIPFTKLHRRLSSSQNYSPLQQQQHLQDDLPDHERSRRLSLDLLKAPFNWSRRRRATCAASDLRRVITFRPQVVIMDSTEPQESHISKVEDCQSSCKDQGSDFVSKREGIHTTYAQEILKSSKYHPDECGHEGERDEHEALNEEGPPSRRMLWRQHSPQQPQEDGSVEVTDMKLPRRRHSVFSNSFMEERPRKQEMQSGHEEEHNSEHQHSTSRLSSMVRSRTDTVLDQHQDQGLHQHRRHSSANYHRQLVQSEPLPPPPLPPPSSLPPLAICRCRNTVAASGSLAKEPSPSFSSFESQDVPKVEDPSPTEKTALVSQNAPDDYEDKNQEQRWTPTDSTRAPYDRRPWQLASRPAIVRRESHSYAHDFMKESELWRPNPWVANTFSYGHAYSNSCPSPRDPRPQLRIFPHEKRPFYSERNGFHTQPYGYEESDEHEDDDDQEEDEDENEKDRDNDDQGSRIRMARTEASRDVACTANTIYPTLQERRNRLAHTEGHESQDNTDRYYYEAMRWQEGVAKAHREEQQQQQQQQATMSHFDYLEQSSLLSTSPPPPPRTSHRRLTRRASVAKAKFYKLLHHNSQQQTNSAARQDIRDVDFGDQDVHASDDGQFKAAETCKGLHYHDNDKDGDADNDNNNDTADGLIHYDAGGLNSSSSAYSFTSSFRARVRLTRTKTVLRQVKQRLGAAARSVISEANKAANQVGPLLKSHSLARYHREQTRVDSEEDEI